MKDLKYMRHAIELAKKGSGFTNPNPMVGAVIVKEGEVIGQGYHERYGGLHAERNALKNCNISPQGADMYVTLEPCCHYGKTLPCTDAIINSGITRVVIGTLDPNPQMSGKGAAILQRNNICVETGVLENDCKALIRTFAKFITTGKPYVMMKYAMTMDGKTATYTKQSKWITSEKARYQVQETRQQYSAIMAGVNTIIQDDPMLTCRLEHAANPVRIICDTHLRTPLESRIIQSASDHSEETILATCSENEKKKQQFRNKGCRIIETSRKDGHVNLRELMDILGKMNLDSILLEGGSILNWSALQQGIVDGIQAYVAPKIFGGSCAVSPVGGLGVALPEEAFQLTNTRFIPVGNDFLMESEVVYSCLPEL
ncbi:bifunctional diaminohydroxyphosphoribosylaminopyrimidine deaminase/5-amino-6-(5-phosphoribosylamino)uracil reductase RibD [uncultured Robinsoniella sp.]|uniref:bifunctional diaminohydroxyphosphoribosylaminopyrimidine deaminase/5-amino-6-(5-phosphoribosylamino)uracil reductase RibD n=1 Tax=uncultured Robinsoniella sp. TaxID=904190 RepID=UPI00374E6825